MRGLGRWIQTCRDTRRLGLGAQVYAEGGTRTPTGLRPLAPEASASTSSTTSAGSENLVGTRGIVNVSRVAARTWLV